MLPDKPPRRATKKALIVDGQIVRDNSPGEGGAPGRLLHPRSSEHATANVAGRPKRPGLPGAVVACYNIQRP